MALLANQRPIADINVALLTTEYVKRVEDTTFKEVYSQILAKPEVSVSLRAGVSVEAVRNTSQSADSSPEGKVSKHTMNGNPLTNTYSLTLIDRVMVCTPIAPYFDIYSTKFATSDDIKNKTKGAFTTGSIGVMPKARLSTATGASYNWVINTWKSTSNLYDRSFNNCSDNFISKNTLDGTFIALNSQLISVNLLKINQPFAVHLKLGAFSDAQLDYLDQFSELGINLDDPDFAHTLVGKYGPVSDVVSKYNSSGFDGLSSDEKSSLYEFFGLDKSAKESALKTQVSGKVDTFTKSDQKTPEKSETTQQSSFRLRVPAIDINWGGYVLTVYKDGQLRLAQDGKQLGPLQSIPINDADELVQSIKLVIYPVGTSIYIMKGDMASNKILTNQVAAFDLLKPVMIPETPVMVTFRCGYGAFAFSPVVHPYPGELISPPMGVSEKPDSIVVNVHYVGKFGVGSRGTDSIEFPDPNDKEKIYEYLKGNKIEYEALDMNNGSYLYKIKLIPKVVPDAGETTGNFFASVLGNIYSPAVYMSQIFFLQDLETINYNPSPDIDNCDVLGINVSQAVEGSSATITLNNRKDLANCTFASGGKYTHREGKDTFTGIKPIKIELGYNNRMYRVFTGYVTNYKYTRTGVAQSTVELSCEDRSKKLKEQYAVNLPFFDGWCQLASMYYLARYAGLADNEFYLYQNPVTGAGPTIASLVAGNKNIMQGGCFEGHINQSLPSSGQQGVSSDYLHMRLPMALVMAGDSPNYAFQMGTPIWNCMEEIRSFSNWYLYFNNWGNLVYGPPKLIVDNINQTFKEVADCGDFNEITRSLSVEYNTADTRNYVFLQGLTWLGPKIGTPGGEKGQWAPHISVGAKDGWPNDQSDFAHCPWRRAAFMRNPKWEDVRLLQLAASEMLRRTTRFRGVESFDSWGHPELFPYHVISIDESSRDETGINGVDVIVAAHNLSINASDLLLTSQFSCETLDQTAIDYDPNLPPNKRD